MVERFRRRDRRTGLLVLFLLFSFLAMPGIAAEAVQAPEPGTAARAQTPAPAAHTGGEANLVLPDLGQVDFQGINGRTLLMGGLGVCVLGLGFGLVIFRQLKNLPVHKSMLEISELIYETCKTYLVTQGKFILLLEVFIGAIMIVYFAVLRHFDSVKVAVIILFSLIGIAGS